MEGAWIPCFMPELILMIGSLFIISHGTIYFSFEKEYKTKDDGTVFIKNNVTDLWTIEYILLFLVAIMFQCWIFLDFERHMTYNDDLLNQDTFIFIIKFILYAMTLFFLTVFQEYTKFFKFVKETPEIILLFCFSIMSLGWLVSAKHLIIILLFMELYTFSFYGLTGLGCRTKKTTEASIKYYLLGAIASGIMWLGSFYIISFESLHDINNAFYGMFSGHLPLFTFGYVLFISGLLFKLNSVPFHNWVIDLYKGINTLFVSMFNVFPKIPLMVVFMNIVILYHFKISYSWIDNYIMVIGLIGLIIGIFITYENQHSFKAFMAGSSIANMGNLLIAFGVMLEPEGKSVLFFYLITYIILTLLIFASVLLLGIVNKDNIKFSNNNKEKYMIIDDLTTFNRLQTPMNKGYLWLFILFFLILSSLPPFPTFFMKLNLLNKLLINNDSIWPLLFIIFNLVSNYYYIKVVYTLLKVPKKSELYSMISKEEISYPLISTIIISSIILLTPWYLNGLEENLTILFLFI